MIYFPNFNCTDFGFILVIGKLKNVQLRLLNNEVSDFSTGSCKMRDFDKSWLFYELFSLEVVH